MEKRVKVKAMTEQECIDISTQLRENLVELARVLPFVDFAKNYTAYIESCRLMEELSHITYGYGGGVPAPLKLGILADRMKEPVSILRSLLEPLPICMANRYAYTLVCALENIIEEDILNEDTEVTLNDELFDAPY